jgi:hypothetical protein
MITELNRFDKTNKCEQMKIKLASYVVVLFTILGYVHKQKLSLEPKTKHCFCRGLFLLQWTRFEAVGVEEAVSGYSGEQWRILLMRKWVE